MRRFLGLKIYILIVKRVRLCVDCCGNFVEWKIKGFNTFVKKDDFPDRYSDVSRDPLEKHVSKIIQKSQKPILNIKDKSVDKKELAIVENSNIIPEEQFPAAILFEP